MYPPINLRVVEAVRFVNGQPEIVLVYFLMKIPQNLETEGIRQEMKWIGQTDSIAGPCV